MEISKSISPQDNQQVARLVGFLEYGKALQLLDALVSRSTIEEIEAFDAIVKERDELAVFTHLSRRVQPAPSRLEEPPQNANDDFERRGIRWLTALARVEFGSMLAAFTTVDHPFAATRPTAFDQFEFLSILLDGARTHYWALMQDPNLARVSRESPRQPEVLSYTRRLGLIQALIGAVLQAGGPLTPVQVAELTQWKDQIDGYQAGFVYKIRSYMEEKHTYRTGTDRRLTTEYLSACGRALAAYARYGDRLRK